MKAFIVGAIIAIGLFSCTEQKEVVAENLSLDQLIDKYPDSVELLIKRGEKLLKTQEFELAMSDGARAFRLDSNNFEVKRFYANVLNNRPNKSVEDVYIAQRHYQDLLKQKPKDTDLLVSLASTFSYQQDFETAFKHINNALKINPRYRDAYVLKGSIYRSLGKRDLMKSSYETAVQQDPTFYEAYIMLGIIYQEEGDSLCLEYLTTATQLKPKELEAKYSLAYAYQQFKKRDKAAEIYRSMAKDKSDYYASQALFQMGHMKQFQLGDIDSAMFFYNKAIAKEPRFVEAYHNLGMCYDRIGDKTRALKSFGSALKHDPKYTLSREYADSIRFL